MDLHCVHCAERVDRTATICRACGGDPWIKATTDDVVDLTERDPERETLELLANLMASYKEDPPARRARWGEGVSSELEIDLTPFRVAGRGTADVLPESSRSRRVFRR